MIELVGLDSDKTLVHFAAHARRLGVDTRFVNLREVAAGAWRLAIPDDGGSWLRAGDRTFALDPESSYYCRLIDLSTVLGSVEEAAAFRGMVAALNSWLEHIPGTVVNRPGAYSDNFSKPLHEATLASLGFDVPTSLTSSDGGKLGTFADAAPTIVKPVSGALSTSRLVEGDEFRAFDRRRGPVHLQRYVHGVDVRVHAIGSKVVAQTIATSNIDYRAHARAGNFSTCALPEQLRVRIVEASQLFGLTFTGWDFKVDDANKYWCLEANPMPGYNYYDRHAGYGITEALAEALSRPEDR